MPREPHQKVVPRLRAASLNLSFFCPQSLGIDGKEKNSCFTILAVLTAVLGRQEVSQTTDHFRYAGYTAARLNETE